MNSPRPKVLCGFAALAWIGLAAGNAHAQVGRGRVAPPRAYAPNSYGYGYRVAPAYPTHPRSYQHPWPVRPHTHRDWSTGNENLPLAKPWLHRFR